MTEPHHASSPEERQLDLLAQAISDVGYWTWWAAALPGLFQIEFGGTQLYFPPPGADQPPATRIALRFSNPVSVCFLHRHPDEAGFQWVQDLHEDKIDPPTCSYGEFSWGNTGQTHFLLQPVKGFKAVHGPAPTVSGFLEQPVSLVFWCGGIGLAITAQDLELVNHQGAVALSDIPELHEKWWAYWRNYWDKRESSDALPKDYACEVTIPVGK